ncbi:MAG: excisionase family DNA-binding protein [Armatimonadota bacterium]|nr:helix-turn-helix domain-containing protein [Armatimonadota bacterium]MDW8154988.1 excisionase family DNA-binding protein [Armatimonadota bacterium]
MSSILEMTVEIVKAQAAQRKMGPREIEEAIRRTAAALRAVADAGQVAPPAAQAPAEAGPIGAEEAARRLGVTRLTLYRYIRQGKLPATRQGRAYWVRPEDVAALRKALRPRRRAVRARRRAARPAAARRGRRVTRRTRA